MKDIFVVISWMSWGRVPEVASVVGPFETKEDAQAFCDSRTRVDKTASFTIEPLQPGPIKEPR